jgi:hypothetical protein
MNEQELMELIGSRLPEELTVEQVTELRAALRGSPAVREALLRELNLEQALAERFAPSTREAHAIVHQIEMRLAEQRKARLAYLVLGLFLGLGLLLLAVFVAINLIEADRSPQGAAPAAGTRPPVRPARPEDAPAQAPASGAAIGRPTPPASPVPAATTGAVPETPAVRTPPAQQTFRAGRRVRAPRSAPTAPSLEA